jgi:hypothetical protein
MGIYNKNSQNILNITSSYEQDWVVVENIMKLLDIKYSLRRVKFINKQNKENKMSRIIIQNRDGIIKFCNYIYKNYEIDKMGLKRKFDIFKQIQQKKLNTCFQYD